MNPTSIDKALRLLEYLAAANEPASLQEIVDAVQLPKSSVHRFLNCLQDLGYVSRPTEGRTYQIGPRASRLSTTNPHAAVKSAARPLLRQLNEKFNETVNLGVLSGQQVLYLDFIETSHLLRYIVSPGHANPWNCTAMGMAIAARLEPTKLERLLAGTKFQPLTPHTLTTLGKLRSRLAKIRRTGIAEEMQESVKGVCCLAISLADLGHADAAISIALPKERLDSALERAIIKTLKSLLQSRRGSSN